MEATFAGQNEQIRGMHMCTLHLFTVSSNVANVVKPGHVFASLLRTFNVQN